MTDLPTPVLDWLARTGGGTITRLDRAVARREAWLADVTKPDGSVVEGFLRIERSPRADDPSSLRKEVAIVRALGRTDVPVAQVYGSDDDLGCALFERLPGRADLPAVPQPQQQAVMRDFIDVIARLHTLDPDALGLPDLYRPETPGECALADVDLLIGRHADFLRRSFDPLLKYGIAWLRRFVPERVSRISLVQGDTGPVNFMFQDDRVSAVFDWEWGHLGDPLEDLGNITVREFWNPSGGMAGLLDRYERASGIPANVPTVRYYRVQQQIRGMFGIHAATEDPSPHEPIAWYLAFRYVGDRATCEALAEAMGIEVTPPALPDDGGRPDPLAGAATFALMNDIAPATATPLAAARVRDVEILVRCMERVARLGREVDELERAELATLMATGFDTLAHGLAALNEAIDADALDDRALIPFLYRRAVRREWLFAPCAELYPDRRWSPL